MRFLRNILFVLAAVWLGYYAYLAYLRKTHVPAVKSIHYQEFGDSSSKKNVVGLQVFMEPADYADAAAFQAKLTTYFDAAAAKGWFTENTTVVLPEYVGTWLVILNDPYPAFGTDKLQTGLTHMVATNLFSFARAYSQAPAVPDRVKHAAFAMKAPQMAEVYQQVMSQLAARYRVTLVAGSILLPEPAISGGKIKVNPKGKLYNVSAVFRPDGSLEPTLVKKAFPTADEVPFVCPEPVANLPVFNSQSGKMAVLICADAWYSASYTQLRANQPDFVVVPSYSSGSGLWGKPWGGYSANETPADARADVGKITLGQAWLTHAMGGRATREAGIRHGLNVFLQGNLWDLGADGSTIVVANGQTYATNLEGQAAIINLWL